MRPFAISGSSAGCLTVLVCWALPTVATAQVAVDSAIVSASSFADAAVDPPCDDDPTDLLTFGTRSAFCQQADGGASLCEFSADAASDATASLSGSEQAVVGFTLGASSEANAAELPGSSLDPDICDVSNVTSNCSGSASVTFNVSGEVDFLISVSGTSTASIAEIDPPAAACIVQLSLEGVGLLGTFQSATTAGQSEDTLPRSGTLMAGQYTISIICVADTSDPSNPAMGNRTATASGQASISFSGGIISETFVWVRAPSGVYDAAINWLPSGIPQHNSGRSDIAVFGTFTGDDDNDVTAYEVFANAATAGRFIIDAADVDFTGTGKVFETSAVTPSLSIRSGGNLVLNFGAKLNGVNASIGDSESGSGLSGIELNNNNASLDLSGRIIVGEFTEGELSLSDGATLGSAQAIVGDLAEGQVSVSGQDARWDADNLTIGATTGAGIVDVREHGVLEVVDTIVVGDLTSGILRVADDATVKSATFDIGKTSGRGMVEVTGAQAEARTMLEVSGALRVGVGGSGELGVENGSIVKANTLRLSTGSSAAEDSVIAVRGLRAPEADSTPSELSVQAASGLGRGTLQVTDGAEANFSNNLDLGFEGQTVVEIGEFGDPGDSKEATLKAKKLTVGFDDFAELKVRNGGRVQCSELSVNSLLTGGIGRIRIPGGGIQIEGMLRISGDAIGDTADDQMSIIADNGGLTANALIVGNESSVNLAELVLRNQSIMVISNENSDRECSIGKMGSGLLLLENSSAAAVLGKARVGGSADGGEGLVEIGGDCVLGVSQGLNVGGASPGTIRLLTDTSVLAADVEVNADGSIEGIGFINGALFVNLGGSVALSVQFGLPPARIKTGDAKASAQQAIPTVFGVLTVGGDYEQTDGGVLIVRISGLGPGQFDVLKINGNAKLGGTFMIKFIDGFVPQPSDVIPFLQFSGTTEGQFAEIQTEGLPGGLALGFDPVTGAATVQDGVPNPQGLCGVCGGGVPSMLPLTLISILRMRHRLGRRR